MQKIIKVVCEECKKPFFYRKTFSEADFVVERGTRKAKVDIECENCGHKNKISP